MMFLLNIEFRAAIRTAVGTLVAVLVPLLFNLPTPYWAGMTVVITANLYTGFIIHKAMMRIIGTIIGAAFGYICVGLVADSILFFFVFCFLIIVVCVYCYHLSNYGYAYLLGGLCAFLVIAQVLIDPANAYQVAIWRPVEIGWGVLVSAMVAYWILPNHLQDHLALQEENLFNQLSGLIYQLQQDLIQDTLGPSSLVLPQISAVEVPIETNLLTFKKDVRKAIESLGALSKELGVSRGRIDAIRFLLEFFYEMARQIQVLLLISTPVRLSFEDDGVFEALLEDLANLHKAFMQQSNCKLPLKTPGAIALFLQKIRHVKELDRGFEYALLHFFQQMNAGFSLLSAAIISGPSRPKKSYYLIHRSVRMRYDLDLIKHSVKAGLSVLLALCFWIISGWPGGISGIISSLLISIRTNPFEMTTFSLHRLLGCLIGGGLALIVLYYFNVSLFMLCFLVLVVVCGFAYCTFKFTDYTFIGLQANLAFIISLAQERGVAMVMDPPSQRLGGIVIGIIASFLVANLVWRTNAISLLQRYIAKLRRFQLYNIQQVFSKSDKEKGLYDLASLFWLSRSLIETVEAKKHFSEKNRIVFNELKQQFIKIVAIQALSMHMIGSINRNQIIKATKVLGIDREAYEQKVLSVFAQHSSQGLEELEQELRQFFLHLPEMAKRKLSDNLLSNLLAYFHVMYELLRIVSRSA